MAAVQCVCVLSGCAEPTLPAINCPKPGGNVRVETSKVTSAGYSRRLRETQKEKNERAEREVLSTRTAK